MAGRSREGLYAVEFANAPVVLRAVVVESVAQCSRRQGGGWWCCEGGCECTEVRPAMTKVAGVLMQILWDPREREMGSAT